MYLNNDVKIALDIFESPLKIHTFHRSELALYGRILAVEVRRLNKLIVKQARKPQQRRSNGGKV